MKRPLGRAGNLAVMTALLAVPMIGFAGLATDGARAWVLQSRLYTAVDAAALAMARNVGVPEATRNMEAAGMFWTNFAPPRANDPGPMIDVARSGFLASTATFRMPQDLGDGQVRVAASATIPTYFTRLLGFDNVTVNAVSEARRADLGLEVALVLDVTGSMETSCTTPSDRTAVNCRVTTVPRTPGQVVAGTSNNIDLLRLAAADLVNVLFGARETVPNLWVSVVPYTTTINLGPNRQSWLDATSQANLTGNFAPTTWRGCVEARRGYVGAPVNGDVLDYPPGLHPFRPFLWRSTLNDYVVVDTVNQGPANQRGTTRRSVGDNDWRPILWNASTTGQNAITENFQNWRGNQNVGPNLGCPETPVLPLTASKTTVLDTIQSLRATFRGGTMGNLGLQGGWFTLSPNWRSAWNLGAAPPGHATALPLDYNTLYMRKAIVMMTDGDNRWHDDGTGYPGACGNTAVSTSSFPSTAAGAPGPAQHQQVNACPTALPPTCPATTGAGTTTSPLRCLETRAGAAPIASNADYGGYGRPSDGRATPAQINARMTETCNAIKNAAIGIPGAPPPIVYTVVVSTNGTVSAATQDLYRNCASSPGNYFLVTQADQLRTAFQQIGQQLANLRLVN